MVLADLPATEASALAALEAGVPDAAARKRGCFAGVDVSTKGIGYLIDRRPAGLCLTHTASPPPHTHIFFFHSAINFRSLSNKQHQHVHHKLLLHAKAFVGTLMNGSGCLQPFAHPLPSLGFETRQCAKPVITLSDSQSGWQHHTLLHAKGSGSCLIDPWG